MTITSSSNHPNYALTNLQNPLRNANCTSAKTAGTNPISLSTDNIDFALRRDAPTTDASNHLLLSFALNSEILSSKNLADVGSTIDAYTNSLAGSNVYDSAYTAPSAKFLADLNDLKTAAEAGNQTAAESALAAEKADAPDNVGGGEATAIATGNIAGVAGLQVEATANISDYLSTQGYSPIEAVAEASAVIINGDSLNPVYTRFYTPQTRLQQIDDLALYAANNSGLTRNSVASALNNPLFNIYESLLEAGSGTATDQALTSLDIQYGGSTASVTSDHA